MIDRESILAKARELEAAVNETRKSAKDTAVLAGVAVIGVVVVAYLLGRRRNRPGKTLVEVYRVK